MVKGHVKFPSVVRARKVVKIHKSNWERHLQIVVLERGKVQSLSQVGPLAKTSSMWSCSSYWSSPEVS